MLYYIYVSSILVLFQRTFLMVPRVSNPTVQTRWLGQFPWHLLWCRHHCTTREKTNSHLCLTSFWPPVREERLELSPPDGDWSLKPAWLPFHHSRSCGAEWSWTTAYGFSVHCTTTTYTTAPWWHSFDSCDTTFVASHCSYPFLWPRWMCPRPSFHRTSAGTGCQVRTDLGCLKGTPLNQLAELTQHLFLWTHMGFEPLSHLARMKCYQVTLYGPYKKISHKPFSDLCETSNFLCSVRILSSFYLLLYPLHSWWRTHTLKSKLFPKTVATRLACQRSKTNMCIHRHHFIKYLCKLNFNFFSLSPGLDSHQFCQSLCTDGFSLPSGQSASYLCEVATHRGQWFSTQLHHLVLLNKEKQEPKNTK